MIRSALLMVVLLATVGAAFCGTPEAVEGPYLIREEDCLSIVVMGREEPMCYDAQVLRDGTISLPIAGRIPCIGRSLAELEADLVSRFGERIREPEVSVRVTMPRRFLVYTLGSGICSLAAELEPGWQVSQLIAHAGGIRGSPHVLEAHLRRAGGEVLKVELGAILSGSEPTADHLLAEGDVLVIDDPAAAGVMVVGAVIAPGPVLLTGGQGAAQAVMDRGGVLPGADPSRVLVVHADRTQVIVDLRPALVDQDLAKDVPVGPGDVMVVPWGPRRFPGVVVSGEVRRPGFVPLDPDRRITVGEAIMGPAGGLLSEAGRDGIVLLRREGDTSQRVTGEPGELWAEVLRAGDSVYVPRTEAAGAVAARSDGGGG